MTIAGPVNIGHRLSLAAVSLGLVLAGGGVARADCNADFSVMMSKRMSEIGALNKLSKAGGGKLDPVAACPRLRNLAAAEGEVVSYMNKNKDWCSLPEEEVQKMTATHAKTVSYAAKACEFAVKMRDMKQQQLKQAQTQQPEQTIKLPTGPL